MGAKRLINLGVPVNSSDAANKSYVDSKYSFSSITVCQLYVPNSTGRSNLNWMRKTTGVPGNFGTDLTKISVQLTLFGAIYDTDQFTYFICNRRN